MKINKLNEYKNIHKGSLYAIAYSFMTSDNDDDCQVLVAGSNNKTIQLLNFNFKKDERNDSIIKIINLAIMNVSTDCSTIY